MNSNIRKKHEKSQMTKTHFCLVESCLLLLFWLLGYFINCSVGWNIKSRQSIIGWFHNEINIVLVVQYSTRTKHLDRATWLVQLKIYKFEFIFLLLWTWFVKHAKVEYDIKSLEKDLKDFAAWDENNENLIKSSLKLLSKPPKAPPWIWNLHRFQLFQSDQTFHMRQRVQDLEG